MSPIPDPSTLTAALVSCRPPSAPADAGALGVLEEALGAAGFDLQRVVERRRAYRPLSRRGGEAETQRGVSGSTGKRRGAPGDVHRLWSRPPFSRRDWRTARSGGRGSVDMKSGVRGALSPPPSALSTETPSPEDGAVIPRH